MRRSSSTPNLFKPVSSAVTQPHDNSLHHLNYLGLILKRFMNLRKMYQDIGGSLQYLEEFTKQYNELSDNDKDIVTNLIIKTIPTFNIHELILSGILDYVYKIKKPVKKNIDGLNIIEEKNFESFPIAAANIILETFNNSEGWFWQHSKEKEATLHDYMVRYIEKNNNLVISQPNLISASMGLCAMLIEGNVESQRSLAHCLLPSSKTAVSYNHATNELCIFDFNSDLSGNYPYLTQVIFNCLEDSHQNNIAAAIPSISLHHMNDDKREWRKAIYVNGEDNIKKVIAALRTAMEKFRGEYFVSLMPSPEFIARLTPPDQLKLEVLEQEDRITHTLGGRERKGFNRL